jgi:hypothetical protein
MTPTLFALLLAPCIVGVPLPDGHPAPCYGLLVPVEAARACKLCEVEDLPTCRAEVAACKARLVAERRAYEAILAARQPCPVPTDRVVEVPQPRPWYSSPWFWGPVGLAVGAWAGWQVQAWRLR